MILIGILKGTFVFIADLVRQLQLPVIVDFVGTSTYGLSAKSSQRVTLTKDIQVNIEGKHVLIVEDILDTGLTVDFVFKFLSQRRPSSIKVCALIDKKEQRIFAVNPDYVGFKLDQGFVVGYGIDYAERYRNLPQIYRLKPED